jgi:hypothetical protein
MQSNARRLKRIAAGLQNDSIRHNNRKRTAGRNISYVQVENIENFKVPVEDVRIHRKEEDGKKFEKEFRRKLGKLSRKRITLDALKETFKIRLNVEERLSDLIKVHTFANNVKELYLLKVTKFRLKEVIDEERLKKLAVLVKKRRPIVDSSFIILKQIFKQKLVFRTTPVHAGLVPSFS